MKPIYTVLCGFSMMVANVGLATGEPSSTQTASQAQQEKPNIIFIMADDQGWGDLSIHGNANLRTPHVDSLGRDGARFDHFYVCPVCAPTRAEFLTGRYHPRGGVRGVSTGKERLDLDERTIAEVFKAAGYATGAFGKWHNGSQYPYHPNARGFDEFYGFCSGHWGNYFSPVLEHNGKLVRGKGFIIDDLTDRALAFIARNKERPFFCYVPYNTPHSPMQVPDRFFARFADRQLQLRNRKPKREDLENTRVALAMCENIDWNVGRILKALDRLELTDNTIVVYLSDNGPNFWRWNGGMKGRKGSTDEGGVRVPCLVRWPAKIKAGTRIPQIAAAIDLLPTLTDLAGIPVVNEKRLDGISLAPLLSATATDWPDRMIFSHWRSRVSVRTQRYRLDHAGRLYDMIADPGQRHDIAEKNESVSARLSEAATQWRRQLLANQGKDTRPFPVGYRAHPVTFLPARDGVPHGTVRRSSRASNCSFFTNWTSTKDRITWDIEVATIGIYEAVVYYTCAVEDVGSTVELRFKDREVRGVVAEAYDSPLRGAEHDQLRRRYGESYVKDFKPLKIGMLRLQKGRGPLTLRALEIPGKQVMDVRYVVLTLAKGVSLKESSLGTRPYLDKTSNITTECRVKNVSPATNESRVLGTEHGIRMTLSM